MYCYLLVNIDITFFHILIFIIRYKSLGKLNSTLIYIFFHYQKMFYFKRLYGDFMVFDE